MQLYFVVSGVNVTLKWHDVNKTHGYEIIIFRQSFLNLHFRLSLLAMIYFDLKSEIDGHYFAPKGGMDGWFLIVYVNKQAILLCRR